MEKFLLISLGAVLGANARYWISEWAARKVDSVFPHGILLVNLSGSFLLGFFITLATERWLLDPRWRLLVAVGFFGAYTTFSTYTYDSIHLMLKGQVGVGLLNLLGSALLGILAVGAGIFLAKAIGS